MTFFRDPQYRQFKLKMFVEIFWLKIGAIDYLADTKSIAHLRSVGKNSTTPFFEGLSLRVFCTSYKNHHGGGRFSLGFCACLFFVWGWENCENPQETNFLQIREVRKYSEWHRPQSDVFINRAKKP